MAKLEWDMIGGRFYGFGLDRGVVYPQLKRGYAWNGLTSVSYNEDDTEIEKRYLDGINYENRNVGGTFSGVIEAFTYPAEFAALIGEIDSGVGLSFGGQNSTEFGLAYRTMISDDTGKHLGYKIHILYNVLAVLSRNSSETLTEVPSPNTLSWNISTRATAITGRKPTAEFIIDSRTTSPEILSRIETILYGDVGIHPRLPNQVELIDLFGAWPFYSISPEPVVGLHNLIPRGEKDLQGDVSRGIYSITRYSRLNESAYPGIYDI